MAYSSILENLQVGNENYRFYNLSKLPGKSGEDYTKLPYSIRYLLESAVRNCDGIAVTNQDVENIGNWLETHKQDVEIRFKPARVILQDLTGVPAVVDFAAMRNSVQDLGGNPAKINPLVPVELVIDHSIQVDHFGSGDAIAKNQEREYERNSERFQFLKWGANALRNFAIVPPGAGIVHQVNLEYLARVVFKSDDDVPILYPDSLVGTDSHTTMIDGLGVLGWGVGGIEAEAVMLGQPISMVLPEVIGFKLTGQLDSLCTATDLVLTITAKLRQVGVVGKFVEFFGEGVAALSVADRATISNMCPEYGATVGFFPVDSKTLHYLKQTGRGDNSELLETYFRSNSLLADFTDTTNSPVFSATYELNLSDVKPCVSGPKRPHDTVLVKELKSDFDKGLTAQVGIKGFGLRSENVNDSGSFEYQGQSYKITHGSVVIAAITSCTNTSNPSVMLGAGLLAKNAVEKGLLVNPYIKTSLSPGSEVVTRYLKQSGLLPSLEKLGFYLAGYGCMTCIGNSGSLPEAVEDTIQRENLIVSGVLSGNRNFEGRIHPLTRSNYLASPMLVIAYALAGSVNFDFETQPLGYVKDNQPVFLRDIWPTRAEIEKLEIENILPSMFQESYANIKEGNDKWKSLQAVDSELFPWDSKSTYIKRPPFFDGMKREPNDKINDVVNAHCLLLVENSVTTDHISPAGAIARNSPAARFLASKGLVPSEFNSYGSRRGNDDIMSRGTFANIRLNNKLVTRVGPRTLHVPSGTELDIFDAAMRYKESNMPVVVIAGKEYGSGSSRDWAAKGPYLLGVGAVVAESFERIHRSNLVGMGIIPLQFNNGEGAESLGLTGHEQFTVTIPPNVKPGQPITVGVSGGNVTSFEAKLRVDTDIEIEYMKHGGILNYMIRKFL